MCLSREITEGTNRSLYGREDQGFQEGGISMKTYEELREELDIGYLLELNEKLDQDEKERNISTVVDTDSCIYKSVFEEGIQRRKKSQTEYISRVGKLYHDLKQTQGDDKIDVIGKLIEVIIQHQLFGMK